MKKIKNECFFIHFIINFGTVFDYDTLDDAKASIDEKYQEKERKYNKRKVKEVVKYY